MKESKIAHGPSGGADVEGIARIDQDNAQMIEFRGYRQAENILRQHVPTRREGANPLRRSESSSKPFAATSIPWGPEL